MSLLVAANVGYAIGDRVLLDGASLTVEADDRIGIVGRNGSGKSTLLRLLEGSLLPDSGSITRQRNLRLGYLPQEPDLSPGLTLRQEAAKAFEELTELHHQLDDLYARMAQATGPSLEKLLRQQDVLEKKIDALGGYAIDHRIDAVLHGLGFSTAQFDVPVSGLSGGQAARLSLAKLLLAEPDVLLLDEPTNHLDIEGRLWLEKFLTTSFAGAVLLISHDRRLLDNVVTRIEEVEQGRLIDYPGNYATFRKLRKERMIAQLRAYENEQTRFRQEEAFIRKYKAGQRAKQARGRESRLNREKTASSLERPLELDTFSFDLPKAPRTGDIVLSARNITKAYLLEDGSSQVLFDDLSLSIGRGERWALIGPNGAGKTTLVRTLLGEVAPDSGTVKRGTNLIVGYFRQSHEGLPLDKPVYRYLQDVIRKECEGVTLSEQQARDLAGAFLFSGAEQEKELGVLSGGERARAVLAGLLASAKNLLVLDEPTNHLDIPSAERLEEALSPTNGYDGTLVLISHDRALIDATCDHLLIFDGRGHVELYPGNYSQWRDHQRAKAAAATPAKNTPKRPPAPSTNAASGHTGASDNASSHTKEASASRKKNKFSWMQPEQLEERMGEIQAHIALLDEQLGDVELWKDAAKVKALQTQRQQLADELDLLEEAWLLKMD